MKGSLVAKIQMASDIFAAKHATQRDLLDRMTDGGDSGVYPSTVLTRAQHDLLLANDQNYQASLLAKVPFMTEGERKGLLTAIQRADSLQPAKLPPEVGTPPQIEGLTQ